MQASAVLLTGPSKPFPPIDTNASEEFRETDGTLSYGPLGFITYA